MAVGAIEPQFRRLFLEGIGVGEQHEQICARGDQDEEVHREIEHIFRSKDRAFWAKQFEGSDACVAPVLGLREAAQHPHTAARGTYVVNEAGAVQPGVAPRFLGTPSRPPAPARPIGADTDAVLRELGFDDNALAHLRERAVVA